MSGNNGDRGKGGPRIYAEGGNDPISLLSNPKGDYMMAVLRVMWEQQDNYSLAFVVQPDKNMTAILPKSELGNATIQLFDWVVAKIQPTGPQKFRAFECARLQQERYKDLTMPPQNWCVPEFIFDRTIETAKKKILAKPTRGPGPATQNVRRQPAGPPPPVSGDGSTKDKAWNRGKDTPAQQRSSTPPTEQKECTLPIRHVEPEGPETPVKKVDVSNDLNVSPDEIGGGTIPPEDEPPKSPTRLCQTRAEVTSVDQRGVVFDIGAGKKAFIEASDVVDFVAVDASGDGTTSKKVDMYFLMKQLVVGQSVGADVEMRNPKAKVVKIWPGKVKKPVTAQPGQNVDGNKLFVHNVNAETSKDRLKKAFGKHGRVMDAVNSGKNFAFITYSCPEEVQAAISAMNGTVVCGRKILCEAAKPDREGRGGRGGDCLSDVPRVPQNSISEDSTTPITAPQQEVSDCPSDVPRVPQNSVSEDSTTPITAPQEEVPDAEGDSTTADAVADAKVSASPQAESDQPNQISSEEVKFKVGESVMAIYDGEYYPAVVTEGPTPTDEGEDYYSVEHIGYEGYPANVWFSQMYRPETETEETQTQGGDSTLENTAVCTDEIKGEIEIAEGGVTSEEAMEQPDVQAAAVGGGVSSEESGVGAEEEVVLSGTGVVGDASAKTAHLDASAILTGETSFQPVAADVTDDPEGLIKDYEDRMSGVYACGGRVDSNNNMTVLGIPSGPQNLGGGHEFSKAVEKADVAAAKQAQTKMEPIAEAEEGEDTIKGKATPSGGGGDLGATTVTDLIDCHIDELPPGGIQMPEKQRKGLEDLVAEAQRFLGRGTEMTNSELLMLTHGFTGKMLTK